MKKIHLILLSLLFCSYSYSQSDSIPKIVIRKQKDTLTQLVFTCEKMPEFLGGQAKLYEFLAANKKYPKTAKEQGIQGKFYIEFVVEKDGSISNVRVMRGIGGGCDKEAVRVVKLMPNWIPGKQRGKPVRTVLIIPIRFKKTR